MRKFGFLIVALISVCLFFDFDRAKADLITEAAKNIENMQENQVTLVTDQKQVWINCQAKQTNQPLPKGFCERLLADFAKTTGQIVHSGIDVPEGMNGLVVLVDQISGRRAAVALIAGRGKKGAFVESSRQDMRLGGVDAPLQAGAAQALVFPMVGLLAAMG